MSTTNDGLLTRYGYDAAGQQRSHTIVCERYSIYGHLIR